MRQDCTSSVQYQLSMSTGILHLMSHNYFEPLFLLLVPWLLVLMYRYCTARYDMMNDKNPGKCHHSEV
jgi:hypothetical protein